MKRNTPPLALPAPAERRGQRRHLRSRGRLTIADLPWIISTVLERRELAVLPGYEGVASMSMRHLRRKPGKGLLAVYNAYPARSGRPPAPVAGAPTPPVALASVKGWARCSNQLLTVTIGEQVLEGAVIRFDSEAVERAPVELETAGIVRARDLALTIQVFPTDTELPALAACFDTHEHGPLYSALEAAAQAQLADGAWRLVAAKAETLRYKPGNRCVILYELTLRHPHLGVRRLVVCGKVYADRRQVGAVGAVLQGLYAESQGTMGRTVAGHPVRSPLIPQPLGLIDELGLQLSEMVEQAGTDPWKPMIPRDGCGLPVDSNTPSHALRSAAAAMARLHTSTVSAFAVPPRTASGDVKQVRDRAARIAEANPTEADTVLALSRRLTERLEAAEPGILLPGHGSFKPTQLLFRDGDAFVIDLDAFGLADPAGDVGCFLAYLRPNRLWYRRSGLRQWFDRAADEFVCAYRRAMIDLGVAPSRLDCILERARAYEAAKLFRIAVRHVTRDNSPRPEELSAVCVDIGECLDNAVRWRTASLAGRIGHKPAKHHGP